MKVIFKALLAAIILSGIAVCPLQANESIKKQKQPRMAVDFKLNDAKGNPVSSQDYIGKESLLLVFWTTWCPFCSQELQKLNQSYPELKKYGIEVLAVNIGEPVYRVENFLQRNNFSFKVLFDKDTVVARKFNVLGVPTFILVNIKGMVVGEDIYFSEDKFKALLAQ